jgi:hypothetical protein
VKLRLRELTRRRKRRRRPAAQAPKTIVPPANPFDAARDRLKRQIPPRED